MEDKKIITTKEELTMVIGLSAEYVCDKFTNICPDIVLMDFAAEIANGVIEHYNGSNPFTEKDIATYNNVERIVNLLKNA